MRKSKLHEIRRNNRTIQDVKDEREGGYARLLTFGGEHKVEMVWGMNQQCIDNQVFLLKVGDKETYLNAEDIQRFLRWV